MLLWTLGGAPCISAAEAAGVGKSHCNKYYSRVLLGTFTHVSESTLMSSKDVKKWLEYCSTEYFSHTDAA